MSGRAKNPPMTQEQITMLAEPKESRMYQGKGQTAEVNRQLVGEIVGDMATEMKQAADESRRFPLSDLQSVERIARQYVVACANRGSLPSVSGLAAALGRTRTAVYKYADDHKAFADFLTAFSDRCGECAAQAAIVGATAAIPTLFLLKARHGWRDTISIEAVQPKNNLPKKKPQKSRNDIYNFQKNEQEDETMSQYAKSSQRPVFVEGFQTPKTQAEFDALSYPQKVALFEQQPKLYKLFTKRPEDEEKQW